MAAAAATAGLAAPFETLGEETFRSGSHEERNTHASHDAEPGEAGVPARDSEPDARFTLANERTFLAWSRTALALVVAGLAIAQLLPPFSGVPWGRSIIATPLILLGAAVSVISYLEWTGNQRALRAGQPLGRTLLPRILALTIALIALLAAALYLYSRASMR